MRAREAKNSLSPHLAHLACGSPLLSGVGTPNRTRRDPGRAAVRSVAPVLLGRETPQGRGERQPAWWNPPWGPDCVASVGATTSHLKGPLGVIYLCYFGWRQFSQLQGFSQGPIRASPAPDGRPRSHGQHKKPVPGEATCPGLVRSPRGACHRALGTCVGVINSGVRFPAAAGTRAA